MLLHGIGQRERGFDGGQQPVRIVDELSAILRHSCDALARSELSYCLKNDRWAAQNSASNSFSVPVTSASF